MPNAEDVKRTLDFTLPASMGTGVVASRTVVVGADALEGEAELQIDASPGFDPRPISRAMKSGRRWLRSQPFESL